jgi:NAD(P)-dependent dehydrogenase (short-subunit alcohol dehydrogenase family)
VDILMNNAGVAVGGGFLDTSLEDWDWILGINLRGVVLGCHYFVPPMVKRGRGGHVVNVASAAGFTAMEYLAAYCTTKFAVVGLSESLREELARRNIGVTAICPGIIDTPITENARLVGTMARVGEARKTMVDGYKRRAYGPDRVAENVLKAIARNRAIAPITPEAWAFYYLKRLAPGLLRWISARIGERTRREYGIE